MRIPSIVSLGLALGMSFLAGACTVGATGPGTGDDIVGDDDNPPPVGGEISGPITSDQTWQDAVVIAGDATINAGVTVTVAPGTAITAKDGVTLFVEGTFEAAGTEAAPISLTPTADATTWSGIVAQAGGSVHLAYATGTDVAMMLYCHEGAVLCHYDHVEFTGVSNAITAEGPALVESSRISDISNGGITVRNNGNLTVRDTYILTSSGDLLVQNGGTLVVEYSEIGDTLGSYDHCDFHIAGGSVSITHTNIINGVVGMMLGGTTGAVIQYNNWMGNDSDLQEIGVNTGVDMQFNYWAAGAPALGGAYDVSNAAGAQLTDAGPRL
ncbi:MAG: hypothetical protein H6709_05035 [Kofleriaceae bacterium]|nr:hypothetical protein [Myxococcales bacterium]MCB9559825.1 hypothetical protein [Kofleriaceae bacterium]MCB9571436.1 hypothetical protein [Kofleriaceae bacterium]